MEIEKLQMLKSLFLLKFRGARYFRNFPGGPRIKRPCLARWHKVTRQQIYLMIQEILNKVAIGAILQ